MFLQTSTNVEVMQGNEHRTHLSDLNPGFAGHMTSYSIVYSFTQHFGQDGKQEISLLSKEEA